ncbi:GNAT family N-acetyltransferase [Lacticaseibacillus saniviri]
MQTIIKPVTLADLATLQAISRETFSDTFGADNTPTDLAQYLNQAYGDPQLTKELTTPGTTFYFIEREGQLAGYLKVNVGEAQSEKMGQEALEIERIYIKTSFKRQGLGSKLYQFALELAQEQHKQYIWLGVWEHNVPALKFYRQLGFVQIGDHVFQLGADQQRDLLMRKTLD